VAVCSCDLPGVLLVVPFFVTLYRTGKRIRLVEERAGSPKRIRTALGPLFGFLTLLTILLSGGCLFYFQDHLNAAWTGADAAQPPSEAPALLGG